MVGPALLSAMTGTAYAYRCFNAPVVKDGGPSGKNDRPWWGWSEMADWVWLGGGNSLLADSTSLLRGLKWWSAEYFFGDVSGRHIANPVTPSWFLSEVQKLVYNTKSICRTTNFQVPPKWEVTPKNWHLMIFCDPFLGGVLCRGFPPITNQSRVPSTPSSSVKKVTETYACWCWLFFVVDHEWCLYDDDVVLFWFLLLLFWAWIFGCIS